MDLFIDNNLTYEETLRLRQTHISGACQLHFGQNPIKIVRSNGQFLINDLGESFLDFGSRVSNVGHCHPRVVAAGQSQMGTLNFQHSNDLQKKYARALLDTLPSNFEVCLFTSSGAEANDLAIQLARHYTRKKGIVAVENAFHGAVSSLIDISPKAFKKLATGKKPWVHVVPLPDTYRGPHANEIDAAQKCFLDAKDVIDRGHRGGEIACFISEPIFVVQGTIVPPQGWLQKIYSYIRELGGVNIADEIQIGMGRSGPKFWAFETQNAIPDILTIGKPMGNGYPIAAVITSKKIAESVLGAQTSASCGPVAAAIGIAVLDIINEEKILEHVAEVSKYFYNKMLILKSRYNIIGDVRCSGLMLGLDIVWSKESRKPAPQLADKISLDLKERHIIVASEGEYSNVLNFMPPLCVTLPDIDNVMASLQKALDQLELEDSDDIYSVLESQPGSNLNSEESENESSSQGFISTFPSTSTMPLTTTFLPSSSSDTEDSQGPNYNEMD